MLMNKFLPYAKPSITEGDLRAVSQALQSEMITRGPLVEKFENEIVAYCGCRFAVAFNSGTTALQAAAFAADLTPYDQWMTSPNTFIASAGPALKLKIDPLFIDIDRRTGNLDLNLLEPNLKQKKSRGKTIFVPVHFSGIALDMRRVDHMMLDHAGYVIEDAAHALGSTYPESRVRVGSCQWSDMTIFSFHPTKTITTGEGGMVTTNDPDLFHRLRLFRNNGIEKEQGYLMNGFEASSYYEVQAITGNYHLTEFQAALGLSQLSRLEEIIAKRQALVKSYRQLLSDIPGIRLLSDSEGASTAYHLLVVQIDFAKFRTKRLQLIEALKEQGIGSQVHYIPLYHHPVFKQDIREFFPEMEAYYQQCLSLPLYEDLSEEDTHRVVKTLRTLLN